MHREQPQPNVYNTSSTITVPYHPVGDTNVEYSRSTKVFVIVIIVNLVIIEKEREKRDVESDAFLEKRE